MEIIETKLQGAYLIKPQELRDERGFFARVSDSDVFAQYGINFTIAQSSISFNHKRGTLRGMHYQAEPYSEGKLVRCTMGSLTDVIVDLRPASTSYMRWIAVMLTADNRYTLWVPPGFAHGFQTLEHNTEVLYQITEFYHPEAARGLRWNDPAFGIEWPLSDPILSQRDREFPDFIP